MPNDITTLHPAPRDLRSVSEIAEMFSIAPGTVRRWIQQGYLPAVKIGGPGGRWRIDIDDALALLTRDQAG